MPPIPRLCIALSLTLLLPVLAHAGEADPNSQAIASLFDTEHIFGFAEGSDIGAKGESEIESVTIGSFGALGGYSNIDNETSLRYGITNELRLSIGSLADYFNIHNVPGLNDRSAAEFSGIITEMRWHILDWRTSPFGMTLSLNPLWRLTDPVSGQGSSNFAAPVTLLIDKEVIPEKLFAVLNLSSGQMAGPNMTILLSLLPAVLTQLRQAFLSARRFAMKISPKMAISTRMRSLSALSLCEAKRRLLRQNRMGCANSGPCRPKPRSHKLSAPSGGIAVCLYLLGMGPALHPFPIAPKSVYLTSLAL
jgi:hypothetical protein